MPRRARGEGGERGPPASLGPPCSHPLAALGCLGAARARRRDHGLGGGTGRWGFLRSDRDGEQSRAVASRVTAAEKPAQPQSRRACTGGGGSVTGRGSGKGRKRGLCDGVQRWGHRGWGEGGGA